jgi:hypothetical protein
MNKTLLSLTLVITGSLAAPNVSQAVPMEVVSAIESDVLDRICSARHREWLLCFNEDPSKCREIGEQFVRPCLEKQLKGVNTKFDVLQAGEAAIHIIDCFNTTFLQQHPTRKKDSPACDKQPNLLQ